MVPPSSTVHCFPPPKSKSLATISSLTPASNVQLPERLHMTFRVKWKVKKKTQVEGLS
jgi:hypothetical protein